MDWARAGWAAAKATDHFDARKWWIKMKDLFLMQTKSSGLAETLMPFYIHFSSTKQSMDLSKKVKPSLLFLDRKPCLQITSWLDGVEVQNGIQSSWVHPETWDTYTGSLHSSKTILIAVFSGSRILLAHRTQNSFANLYFGLFMVNEGEIHLFVSRISPLHERLIVHSKLCNH